ncbi:VWA domain-containing protein [Streptomyces sp. NPDC050504]|uniref:VWA domain-containing protein n=1 Tax=Streptomyces sp. NPDC050504 TaxID=3365618 RepID=UPI0037B61C5C
MTAPGATRYGLADHGLADHVTGLVRTLREHGLRIGTGESVDAAAVVDVLGLADRERLRAGLAAALLHQEGQRSVFDPVFDLYFPLTRRTSASEGDRDRDDRSRDALRDRLADALAAGDQSAMAQIAADAVDALGGYGSSPGSDGWSAHQTLDRMRPQTLLAKVRTAVRRGAGQGRGTGTGGGQGDEQGDGPEDGPGDAFADRLVDDEIRRLIEEFRRLVATEARRRVAERRGTEEIARRAVAPAPDRVDFLVAGQGRLDELRRVVRPLARKLATRLAARRRRAARGTVDLRRTLRGSLSTGGVPMRPVLRRRRPVRPELVLLCDVSGSVAGFSDFTMLLVQALREQFSKVRIFAFVNRTDEVTALVTRGAADPAGLGARIQERAALTGWHGSSDYGTALGEFVERYGDAVGPRTTVFVLGDARTNQADPNFAALRHIADRARQVHWFNPERRSLWPTGDSAALGYAGLVPMHECRNAEQLGALTARLLPV